MSTKTSKILGQRLYSCRLSKVQHLSSQDKTSDQVYVQAIQLVNQLLSWAVLRLVSLNSRNPFLLIQKLAIVLLNQVDVEKDFLEMFANNSKY